MITMEENMRRVTVLFLVIWFVTCVSACRKEDSETMSLNPTEIQNEDAEVENTDNIFVYVCGAVQNEGVYELPAGSRVYEAIEKAGFTPGEITIKEGCRKSRNKSGRSFRGCHASLCADYG